MATENKYATAAEAVLTEIGGGPISSKALVNLVKEKSGLPDTKFFYHYVLKAVKDDVRFDTSKRGQVGLTQSPVFVAEEA